MKTHKVGLVGLGWAAGAHLRTFVGLPNYEPVAVMSRRDLNPGELAQEYGVDLRVYKDYDKFLEDPDVEVVDIHARVAVVVEIPLRRLIVEAALVGVGDNVSVEQQLYVGYTAHVSACAHVESPADHHPDIVRILEHISRPRL